MRGEKRAHMIADDLVNDRVAGRARVLEKRDRQEQHSANRAGGKDHPWPGNLEFFRFTSQSSAHIFAQARRSAVGGSVACERVTQRTNLFFDATAIFAAAQMLLDLLPAYQIKLVIDVGVKKLLHPVVIDIHLV